MKRACSIGKSSPWIHSTWVFEKKQKMSDQEKAKVMLLGDRWVELFGGKEKLWRACNAEISQQI